MKNQEYYIELVPNELWKSGCCFGTTSYKERALLYKNKGATKAVLTKLRRRHDENCYPNAEIKKFDKS